MRFAPWRCNTIRRGARCSNAPARFPRVIAPNGKPTAPPSLCASGWRLATGDNLNMNAMRHNMHDWVVANENTAKVLAAKGYHYQFDFARNAGHTGRAVHVQILPEALEYIWQGYPIKR